MTGPAGEPNHEHGGPSRGALLALLVVVVIAVGGLWLANHMRAANRVQDCVMAGRSNCAPAQ